MANAIVRNGVDLSRDLEAIGASLNTELLRLLKGVETVDGTVVMNDANVQFLAASHAEFQQLLITAGYMSVVQSFISSTPALVLGAVSAIKASDISRVFARTDIVALDAIAQLDLTQMEARIAGAQGVLRRSLLDAMTTGKDWGLMQAEISAALDRELVQYTKTYIETSRGLLAQKIEDIGAEVLREAGEKLYWAYKGPLDTKTRPECILGLRHDVFTDEERTTFESTYGRVRYNCRHRFKRIPEEIYSAERGRSSELSSHERLRQRKNTLRQEKLSDISPDRKKFLDREISSVNSQMRNIVAPIAPRAQ